MSEILPRIIGIKLAGEPFRRHVRVEGSAELARMLHLPQGLPDRAVALQFVADLSKGRLKPAPVLLGSRLVCKSR